MKKIFSKQFLTLPIMLTAMLAMLTVVSGIILTTRQNMAVVDKKIQSVKLQTDSSQKQLVKNKNEEKQVKDNVTDHLIFTPTPTPIKSGPTLLPTRPESSTPTPTQAPQPTPIKSETTAPQNQVNLVINGNSSFTVIINAVANQCDVLNQALSQGKISSLNMRYDNNLGTYAVYQINGIGKDNSVWWTYKVNGQAPSQGCSYIKANNNDNIAWTYLGS